MSCRSGLYGIARKEVDEMKYKVSNLSTKVLEEIVQDNYTRHTKKNIRDYVDQIEEIDTLLYTRRCKNQEREIKLREQQVQERLEYLQNLVPSLGSKFSRVKAECLMLIFIELTKIGLSEGDLYENY